MTPNQKAFSIGRKRAMLLQVHHVLLQRADCDCLALTKFAKPVVDDLGDSPDAILSFHSPRSSCFAVAFPNGRTHCQTRTNQRPHMGAIIRRRLSADALRQAPVARRGSSCVTFGSLPIDPCWDPAACRIDGVQPRSLGQRNQPVCHDDSPFFDDFLERTVRNPTYKIFTSKFRPHEQAPLLLIIVWLCSPLHSTLERAQYNSLR
jgi:hypothetical protein